jgi:hypothetical protein
MESQRVVDVDYATTEREIRNLSCINFTARTAETVLAIKLPLSLLAIVVNLVAVIVLVFLLKKKANKFMYRLVLYLLIIDIFQAISIILISLPVTVPSNEAPAQVKPGAGWSNACIASGFLSIATLWMGNIIIFWTALYLAWIGVRVYLRTQNHDIKECTRHVQACCETLGILLLLVAVPFIIALIPLFVHGNMYGLSGLWCWIKVMNRSCGDLHKIPLTLDLVLFYAPLIVIVLLTTISSVIAVTCCCRGGVRRHDAVVELRKSNIKDIVVVLVIPLAYCALCLLLLISRIHSATHEHQSSTGYPYTPLWITHAVADPIRVILPALVYLLNPLVWKDIHHVCTHTPDQDSPQQLHSLEPNAEGYGSITKTAAEYYDDDNDVTDDEYTRSLLKDKTKM